jgi:hypothetical protein
MKSRMRFLFPLGMGLLSCASAVNKGAAVVPPDGWVIPSPGGVVTVQVRYFSLAGTADYPAPPRLYYRVTLGGGEARTEMLRWSPLGITRKDADFTDDLHFLGENQRRVTDEYTLPRGKRSHFNDTAVEQVLSFETPQHARMDLIVRAYDDGFAFRYHFPETNSGRVTVAGEATGFRFVTAARAILLPQYQPGASQAESGQAEWLTDVPAGTPAPAGATWALPALFASADGAHWALLAESGLAAGHAALGLAAKSEGEIYRFRFPHPDEEAGRGDVQPNSTLPWSSPWRVVIVSDGLAGIVESGLVTDLAAPAPAGAGDWVRPDNVAWHMGAGEASAGRGAHGTDLAAAMGWGYAGISAGGKGAWHKLVHAAASKKVGLLVESRDAACRLAERQTRCGYILAGTAGRGGKTPFAGGVRGPNPRCRMGSQLSQPAFEYHLAQRPGSRRWGQASATEPDRALYPQCGGSDATHAHRIWRAGTPGTHDLRSCVGVERGFRIWAALIRR